MSEIKDVHQQIEEEFVKCLQNDGFKPAVTEELAAILSANKPPKPADLLEFYGRHSNCGVDK